MSVTIKCSSSLKLMLLVKSPLSIWILLLCSACFKLCPSSNGPVLQTFIISKLVRPFLEQVELKRLYWGSEIGVKGGVNQFLDGIAEVMYGSNPAILFISQHLTSSLFSWKPFKDVNVFFYFRFDRRDFIKLQGKSFFILSDFFILKTKGSPERVFPKICFRYKMMAIFFNVASVNNLLKSFTAPELQDLHSTLKLFSQLTEEASW